MKKKMQLLLLLVIFLIVGGTFVINENQKLQLELSEDDSIFVLLTTNYKQQRIYPWYNESDGRYYFFLPAYCNKHTIRFNGENESKAVFFNGMAVQSGSKFDWQEDDIYQLEILTEDANTDYDIIF